MIIRSLTYNVHKFQSFPQRRSTLYELKQALSQIELDIVLLQEVSGGPLAESEDPLEQMADTLWDHFVYGKNAVYEGGSHGNAILSKYPLGHWQNHDISNHALERRSLLLAEVLAPIPFFVACTHLDLTAIGRRRQIRKILTHLKDSEPLLLGGDFNDWSGRTVTALAADYFSEVASSPTYPNLFPVLTLDRFLYRGFKLLRTTVLRDEIWRRLSDHLPLYTEFELTA